MAQQAVQALRRGLGDKLVAVVLFGSRARGDAREDSDWDLLVIARDLPADYLDRHFMLKRMLPEEIRGMVSIVSKAHRSANRRCHRCISTSRWMAG